MRLLPTRHRGSASRGLSRVPLTLLGATVTLLLLAGSRGESVAAAVPVGMIVYDRGDRLELSDLSGANRRVLVTTPRGRTFFSPVWSRDGTKLAFSRGGSVYVVEMAHPRLRRVAGLPGRIGELHWSPDGGRLAFGYRTTAACSRHRPSDAGLFVVDAKSGVLRESAVEPVRRPRRRALFYQAVGWSAAGTRVLYVEEQWVEGDCGLYLGGRLRKTTLFQTGIGGGRPTRVAHGGPAEWSPTSPVIALSTASSPGLCPIAITGPTGRGRRKILDEGNSQAGCSYASHADRWFMWSPRGDEIFVVRPGESRNEVFAIRIRDRRRRDLLIDRAFKCPEQMCYPSRLHAASSDGRVLVVEMNEALVAVETDGSGQTRLGRREPVLLSFYLP